MILFHCKGPHIRNSRISTQFWPLTCVPPSPVLGDANRCKRAREMDQFGRWTLCRSVDLFCKAGTCNLWCLCSILIFRGCTVNSFILTFYFFQEPESNAMSAFAGFSVRASSVNYHMSRLAVGWLQCGPRRRLFRRQLRRSESAYA